MHITLNLPDDVGQELRQLPNPDTFVADLVNIALQQRKLRNQPVSKWARIVERIAKASAGLGDYTEKFKQDMQEIRKDLVLKDIP